jgi:hypothetical protein
MPRNTGLSRKRYKRVQEDQSRQETRTQHALVGRAQYLERLFTVEPGSGCLDMSLEGKQQLDELADYCWAGDYSDCCSELLDDNAGLHAFFRQVISNHHQIVQVVKGFLRSDLKISILISLLMRMQNQSRMPKMLVIRTVAYGEKRMMDTLAWDGLSATKEMASRSWIRGTFLPHAMKRDPGPKLPCFDLIVGVCADNFTMSCNYKGQQRLESDGWRLDMTNVARIGIPKQILSNSELTMFAGLPWLTAMRVAYSIRRLPISSHHMLAWLSLPLQIYTLALLAVTF